MFAICFLTIRYHDILDAGPWPLMQKTQSAVRFVEKKNVAIGGFSNLFISNCHYPPPQTHTHTTASSFQTSAS